MTTSAIVPEHVITQEFPHTCVRTPWRSAGSIFAGQVGLALLVGANGAVLPAAMAELAPWRVRCTVLSVGYNFALAILGGTTPMVASWLVERSGVALAPAAYLALVATVTFTASLLLPQTARHRLTKEFQATRLR